MSERLIDIGHLPEKAQADIISHIRGKTEEPESGTYLKAFRGWQCFHCGEIFYTYAGARLHFGALPTATPQCQEQPA